MFKTADETINYKSGGLFETDASWIHPTITEPTYEIIYVIKGSVYMQEGGEEFHLNVGDLRILRPDICHGGVRMTENGVSFYWIHFYFEGDLMLPDGHIFHKITTGHIFPEILHLGLLKGSEAAEPGLMHLINTLRCEADSNSDTARFANRVFAWTRANCSAALTCNKVAAHFGYNAEYLSKLMKEFYGLGLKNIIDDFLITQANELLDNTTYTIKEIAGIMNFDDANRFVNFYKYHCNTTPSKYRNRNYRVYMNSKPKGDY